MRKVCAKMKWSQNSSVALSQVMNHGFWSMTLRQNAKVGSGTLQNLPISRKPEWKIQNQIDSHLFFWQSGDRPQGICATRKNCQSNFLSGSPWKTHDKGGTCATRHCTHLEAAPRNAPCHMAVSSNEFLAGKRHSSVPQPPYSSDLSPCDFLLFPRLKNHLKGRHFGTLDNVQKSVTDELKGIPAEAFQHCYKQWKQRLRRCVAAQGNYFEGDNLDL